MGIGMWCGVGDVGMGTGQEPQTDEDKKTRGDRGHGNRNGESGWDGDR